jgi:pimeloyl-ACP methyl ester carboxylesterase
MRTELISIATTTAPLDGVFYTPEHRPARGGVLLFHGNTMNFYTGAPRFLPPVLTELGYACLAFNRRGHDILTTRNSRAAEGGAYQRTQEAIDDNETAARFMAERGFAASIVIGHSNGGMLGVAHVARHPDTPALVLLSAHRGTVGGGPSRLQGFLAGDHFDEIMAKAKALTAAGRGRELIMVPGWWYVLSAESFVDRMTTMPDTLELAPKITCPVLYLRGDSEPEHTYPCAAYQARAGGRCDVRVVENCDHFYNGREAEVTSIVAGWLRDAFGD